MKKLGQLLQILALIGLPMAMAFELTGALGRSFGLSEMLIMLVCGVLMFIIGRLIEGHSAT